MKNCTGYQLHELAECINTMYLVYKNYQTRNLNAVKSKYAKICVNVVTLKPPKELPKLM